ncbi:hypothetical protein P4S72_12810 [Vibrio sp. PP-XX7]
MSKLSFNNLSIGYKIALGFGLVLLTLSFVLFISTLGLKQANDGVSEYRQLARSRNLAGRISRIYY